jgi:3-oxoacid CoA-transferase subunit B
VDEMPGERLDRYAIALCASREFQDGMIVNLGIGIPTLCAAMIPQDKEVLFHSENGVIGYGEIIQDPDRADISLINAGSQPLAYRRGMAIVDHAESFAMVRGGHIDISVLGAIQVSEKGDLANNTLPGKQVGSLGGGQDLAFCAKKVIVCMTHTDAAGKPKIVRKCSSPLTAPNCVDLIVTDIALIEVTEDGLSLREHAPGWSPEEIQALTEPRLIISQRLAEMKLL